MRKFWNICGTIFVLLANTAYFYNPEWLEAGKISTLLFGCFIACIDAMAFANLLTFIYRPKA